MHVDPSLELASDNLLTLCADPCHLVFGHLLNFKSWNLHAVKDAARFLEAVQNRPVVS